MPNPIRVSLLCAASGTQLTQIANTLDSESNTIVKDLETELCKSYHKDTRLPRPTDARPLPTMAQLIVRIGRAELYERWASVCGEILDSQSKESSATCRLVALHLNWYDRNTGEFFSPVNPRVFDRDDICIEHVVILIDDIYDMFCRLQEPHHLYSQDVIDRRAKLLSKLSYPSGTDYKQLGDHAKKRLRLESIELALTHLIHWRRAEMIHAENIARYCNAELTVLGTKHSRKSLRQLVGRESVEKIYLSHRITEPRRMNKADNTLPDILGEWAPTTGEVNSLHWKFANKKQLLINPTAIDELRFDDPEEYPDRSPMLAARWPLPEPHADLLWSPPSRGYEHTELLSAGLNVADPVATGVARSLGNQIYIDISFRDHLLVETTPNLFVYRPFFSTTDSESGTGVDWSGGVGREIAHWIGNLTYGGGNVARIAFVHTRSEIRSRLRFLEKHELARAKLTTGFRKHFEAMVERLNITAEELAELYAGVIGSAEDTQLGHDPPSNLRDSVDEVVKYLKAAATIQLVFFFTGVKAPEEDVEAVEEEEDARRMPSYILAREVIEQPDHQIADEELENVVSDLSLFFAGDMADKTVEENNRVFVNTCIAEFEQYFGQHHEEYVSGLLSVPYRELTALADIAGVGDS